MRSAKAAPKPWDVIYYRASDGSVPASDFLDICPPKVHARLPGPAIALITGMRKPWMTKFSGRDYRRVLDLGTEHLAQYPRRIKES